MISCCRLRKLSIAALNGLVGKPALLLFLLLLALQLSGCKAEQPQTDMAANSNGIMDTAFSEKCLVFERKLAGLARKLKIPSVSVAVVKSGKVVFARGYGYSSLERKIPAAASTFYHIASITKTFTAAIILNLADAGKLDIDDNADKYGINVPAGVTIRHLMSHTSNFVPGSVFYYNSTRFNLLGKIIEKATGKAYTQILSEMILEPLDMASTIPNPMSGAFVEKRMGMKEALDSIAKPYKIKNGVLAWENFPSGFSPSAGLVSCVNDLAKYAAALENNQLFGKEISQIAYSPVISINGDTLPYGLGWFVQWVNGKKAVWHYGDWTGNSSLLMRIPEDSLTLIMLANTDGLSAPFMGLALPGDVTYSPFANAFLKIFISNSFDDSFIKEYYNTPGMRIISKYSVNNNLFDLVKEIIAAAEIEMEMANEKNFINLLEPLYNLFNLNKLSNYTGRYSTKSFNINIKTEKGILKAVLAKKNKSKKKNAGIEDTEEYFIFPERENLFYLNTYKKIRLIIGPDGKAKSLELIKLGEKEYGRRH